MEFETIYKVIENIPGWFSKEDAKILMNLIIKCKHEVVEVGSFFGKSATFISHFKNVTCIDPWIANEGLKKKIKTLGLEVEANGDFSHIFKLFAIEKNKHGKKIRIIQKPDYQVFDKWESKVGILFLDHHHTYEAVMKSLFGWKKHMCKYGKILIHDSNWKEVKKGIDDSGIHQYKSYKNSIYEPMLCSWDKIKI